MLYKILIVEDDPISGQLLEMILEKLGHKSLGIVSTAEGALLSIKNEIPELVFMDINLASQMNGIYTAELLSGYYNIPVIFVSAAIDAQTISLAGKIGIGYIVKPFTEEDIKSVLDQAKIDFKPLSDDNKAKLNNKEKIKVGSKEQIMFLDLNDIYLFESEGHNIHIYTKNQKYTVRGSLAKYKKMDKDNYFIMVHKSFLVNLNKIESMVHIRPEYSIIIKDIGKKVPLSRKKVHEIKEFLLKNNIL